MFQVLLHCLINALPYEKDSQEDSKFEEVFGDEDHSILLDEQQQKTLDLNKNFNFEDIEEKFLDEKQNHELAIDLVKKIEDEIQEEVPDDQPDQKILGFDEKINFDEGKILVDDQQKQQSLDLGNKVVTDKPKPAKYEVTEFVIDVPDDRTRGPIITNFSIPRPLNIIPSSTPTGGSNEDKSSNEEGNANTSTSKNNSNKVGETDEEKGSGKKSCISILHVKAEIDDKTDKTNKDKINSGDYNFVIVPHVSGIKEYFKGIKKGIVNGFNSIILRQKNNEDDNNNDSETGPFNFFNKISKKSSDFATKIHNRIFGDQEEGNS